MPYKKFFQVFFSTSLITLILLLTSPSYAEQDILSLFPISNYDQNVSTWINNNDPDFNKPLLDAKVQTQHTQLFFEHYFGRYSPWNANHINQLMHDDSNTDDLKTILQRAINGFDNEGKSGNQIGYGENFRPYTKDWILKIANNMNIEQFGEIYYQSNHLGIAVDNLYARALPTHEVYFYHHKLAGEGFPFDNLQESAIWAGTPVYVLGETRDHAWNLVMTPEYIAWVPSKGIARADDEFIQTWTAAAKNKLAAITHTQTSLIDNEGQFLLTAYVGSVFPGAIKNGSQLELMVPVADASHHAVIKRVNISSSNAALMPLAATPHHFSSLIKTLIGRPYGWGGIYFYNDCSAELKNLFTPFGIWLPRNSSQQITAGKMVDQSNASKDERLKYLIKEGHPFLTLVRIKQHIVLYIGHYNNPNQPSSEMVMTYQNVWGLHTAQPSNTRAVIGGSVLFPMLSEFPEDSSLNSQANDSYFQLAYLDEIPTEEFHGSLKTLIGF